ncbi:hypothetical protein GIB67_032330, partial [Kingdonia uniflora]
VALSLNTVFLSCRDYCGLDVVSGGYSSSVLGLFTILFGRWLSYMCGVRIIHLLFGRWLSYVCVGRVTTILF